MVALVNSCELDVQIDKLFLLILTSVIKATIAKFILSGLGLSKASGISSDIRMGF